MGEDTAFGKAGGSERGRSERGEGAKRSLAFPPPHTHTYHGETAQLANGPFKTLGSYTDRFKSRWQIVVFCLLKAC